MADDHSAWVARDARVVWHGFTQMAAYADNAPLIVEAGDGRELIDVEGRRYLDAISSLWVTTLGHRVPELDQAVRDQLDRVAHSTLLGNGNRVVVELAEALAAVVPVDEPHLLFASDGAAAVEQGLKVAFQHWMNRGVAGRDRYLAFSGAYHGDTIGSLSVGDGGFGTDVFDPLRFPVVRAPYGDLAATEAILAAEAPGLAAVVVEPLVQGAAGMALQHPGVRGGGGRRVPAPRRAARCATRSPPASGAPAPSSRWSSAGSGPTSSASARASRVATSRCPSPSRRAVCSRRSSARTSRSGRSTTGTPTAGTPSPRPSPSATSS